MAAGSPSLGAVPASPARRTALTVLRRVEEQGAYADRALHGDARDLDARDRALAKRLVFGTVQRRGTLDWIIAQHVDRKLDPQVRAALLLGLYQLLYTEVPAHAAVAESVELAKPSPGAKLVNAVLRKVQREGVELPADDNAQGRGDRPLAPRVADADVVGLARRRRDPRAAGRRQRARRAGAARSTRWRASRSTSTAGREDDALVVEGPIDVLAHPLYAAGAITPQSRASQRVARAVDPQPGERVLDLCAAPGGKTTHLAALMGDAGEVVAVEKPPAARQGAGRPGRAPARDVSVRVHVGDAKEVTADDARRPLRPRPRRPAVQRPGHAAHAPRPALARDARRRSRRCAASRRRSSPPRARVLAPAGASSTRPARCRRARRSSPGTSCAPCRTATAPTASILRRQMATSKELGLKCPGCGEPWLRPTTLAGPLPLRLLPAPLRAALRLPRLRRARDDRPDVVDGHHQCNHCGGSMLIEI